MIPTDLTALAVEELERAVRWYTAFARPDRAAQLREAIELVRRVPEIVSRMEAVRPRTLGVDGPPTEYPVLVFGNGELGSHFIQECHLDKQYIGNWLRDDGDLVPMELDDKYVYLRALLEIAQ